MKKEYWLEKWTSDDIKFHQPTYHWSLDKHFQTVAPEALKKSGRSVLVPLCGKSLDMEWFAHHGFQVYGIELIEKACRDFFEERKIQVQAAPAGEFIEFANGPYHLLCGDILNIDKAKLPHIDAIYDRAALIALPSELRTKYAQILTDLLSLHQGAALFLVGFEYPEGEASGPPFSVNSELVNDLFAAKCHVQKIESKRVSLANHPKFAPLDNVIESVYAIRAQSL